MYSNFCDSVNFSHVRDAALLTIDSIQLSCNAFIHMVNMRQRCMQKLKYQLSAPHLSLWTDLCPPQHRCQPVSLQETHLLHLSSLTGNQIPLNHLTSWPSTASGKCWAKLTCQQQCKSLTHLTGCYSCGG